MLICFSPIPNNSLIPENNPLILLDPKNVPVGDTPFAALIKPLDPTETSPYTRPIRGRNAHRIRFPMPAPGSFPGHHGADGAASKGKQA